MFGRRYLSLSVLFAAAFVATGCTEQADRSVTDVPEPSLDQPEVYCSPTQLQGCDVTAGEIGFAVTERNGVQELVLALCGDDPPGQMIVARGPTGGITDPDQGAQYAEPAVDNIVHELRPSDWESGEVTLALRTPSDAPSALQEFMVYALSEGSWRSQKGWTALPPGPWPSHPLALTSASGFNQPVRLGTPRGELCLES